MDTRASFGRRLSILPVLIALLFNVIIPLLPAGASRVAAADNISDYSQCQIGNPPSGLDCDDWINGILNATHNVYNEDEVVPQRLVIDFDDTDSHSVTLSYMTRKSSGSSQHHAYDYLATWNYTFINADRCLDLNPTDCVGGPADTEPIPSDGTSVSPGGPQPTSAHELPQADRQFVMYGATITAVSPITHSTDPAEEGSDYGNVTITFDVTDADGKVMLLFGGHLASGHGPRGWGAGLGAADISGGPYHIRVTALDGESVGNRDNQIMSNAIQPLLPALTIVKTPDGGTVNAGDYASFTITVTNNGPGAATNVDIDDDLPEGPGGTNTGLVWTEFPDVPECSITSNNLHCDIASLADDASFSVTVRALTDAGDCGTLNNTAFADADNNSQVSDTGSVTVQCPNLTISKTPDGGTVNAGSPISFTITVTNSGPGTATNVDVDDTLPAGFTWTESPDLAECTISGLLLHCDIASLGSGASFSVTVTAPTDAGDCQQWLNTATADADNHAQVSNQGDVTVQCPALNITKTPDGGTVNAGGYASFTITVTNTGPGVATNVDIDDDLPEGPGGTNTGMVWTENPDVPECSITSNNLHCDIASLGVGASFSVTLRALTDTGDCGRLDNTAFADADNNAQISNDGDITVTCPEIRVEKTPDESEQDPSANDVTVGEAATFTITIYNDGDGAAEGVALFDDLVGSGWSVVAAQTTLSNCAVSDPTEGAHAALGEILTCGPDTIGAASSKKVTVTKTTAFPADCGELPNNVSVTSTNANGDADSGNIDVLCPDLDIEKTTTTPVVNADDSVSYTITIENAGDGDALGVDLTDELPDGLTWSDDSEDCSISENVLTCADLTIAAGGSFSVTLTATTDSGECPSIENTASFTSANGGSGSSDSGERGATVITVNCPDVTIDKEPVETPISAGEDAEFTIKVWNLGPGTAYDVVVTDTAPEGTVWTVLDADGFTCDDEVVEGQQTLTCTIDELAPGEENARTILIGYDTTPADCGLLDNAVTVFADNEDAADTENNSDTASIVVECPGLNIVKTADADPIDAGEEASFTITVWNAGPGIAFDVTLHDTLPAGMAWDFEVLQGDPDCGLASSVVEGGIEQRSIDCDLGDLAPSEMEDGVIIRVFADTDRDDCGLLENTAFADAINEDEVSSTDTLLVKCPTIALDKENDAVGSVLPGTTVTYTLTLTVADGPAEDVMVVDGLPVGLTDPTNISDGGIYDSVEHTISWSLGDLADGEYTLTYEATVADDVENGEELVNAAAATSTNSQCPDLETLGPECVDDSVVVVRVPTLVIDKVADAEVIVLTGPEDALVATPSVVTWTLTYTLTNGPVTNGVITDEVPVGFVFLDASDGGQLVDGVVTWTFPTLSQSGSVTFRTTVDPETISRTAPTVNVAVIDSDETAPDEGEDSVTVAREAPVLGGNPTPRPSLPNTAAGFGMNGEPITVPLELLVAFFVGSLGALALANVKARERRR